MVHCVYIICVKIVPYLDILREPKQSGRYRGPGNRGRYRRILSNILERAEESHERLF